MCGRLSLFIPQSVLEIEFEADFRGPYVPRYNVAPTEEVAVIRDVEPQVIEHRTWGLVPRWADDPSIGSRLINARAESLAEKPSFKNAYQRRRPAEESKGGRCLVLADGFYEWRDDGGRKQPYRVCRTDDKPFAMAGLWECWEGREGSERPSGANSPRNERAGSGRPVSRDGRDSRETVTIVTTEPNDVVAPLHDRMAAILPPGDERRWLVADDEAERQALLSPTDGDDLRAYPISTRVNDPSNDGPSIIEEIEPEGGTQSGLGDFP